MNTPVLEKWMKRIGLRYFINVYPLQFDHLGSQSYRMQIEHVYRLPAVPSVRDLPRKPRENQASIARLGFHYFIAPGPVNCIPFPTIHYENASGRPGRVHGNRIRAVDNAK